jgi:hypothetical protein
MGVVIDNIATPGNKDVVTNFNTVRAGEERPSYEGVAADDYPGTIPIEDKATLHNAALANFDAAPWAELHSPKIDPCGRVDSGTCAAEKPFPYTELEKTLN